MHSLTVSDRNLKLLQEKLGEEKISTYRVDARDFDQLSRLMKEVDIVVNAAHYSLNLELIDTCLKNGYNYIGLTGGEEFYIQISQRSI